MAEMGPGTNIVVTLHPFMFKNMKIEQQPNVEVCTT